MSDDRASRPVPRLARHAEKAIPVAAPAHENALRVERELAGLTGIDRAALDFLRLEVRTRGGAGGEVTPALRHLAAAGWAPSDSTEGPSPELRRAARNSMTRAIVATLAATAVTILGSLTGPASLAPFLHLIPGVDASLRSAIPIGPVAALWITIALSLGAVAWCGADLFRRAARDLTRVAVTGRLLGAIAIAILTVASLWGAATIFLGRVSPPLLFGAAVWSLAALLAGQALMLARGVRIQASDIAIDDDFRATLAMSPWHRASTEERSFREARAWAVVSLITGIVAAIAWLTAGEAWSIAALATASVLLAGAPASFIAAAAVPVRRASARLGAAGISIRGGATLDRIRKIGIVATNVRGGAFANESRIAELLLIGGASVEQLLGAAAAAATQGHALAAPILRRAGASTLAMPGPWIGTVAHAEARGLAAAAIAEEVARFEAEGKTVLLVASGSRLLGALTVAFDPRERAAETIAWLNARGVRTALLTKNPEGTAAALASQLGFAHAQGGITAPFDATVLADPKSGLRAWVSTPEDSDSIAKSDVAFVFRETSAERGAEDAAISGQSFEAVRVLFEESDAAGRAARARTSWLRVYHLAALPLAAGVLLPVSGLLPAPFLAAAASVAALALASAGAQRRR